MLAIYPLILLVVWFPLTVLTSYLISTLLGHTEADFPYISDTGAFVPESCIFGQMLNMSAVLFALVVYLRFVQVSEYMRTLTLPNLNGHRYVLLISGFTAAFGMSLVANFQETSILAVHMVGAFMAFLSPILYMIADNIISLKTSPMIIPKWLAISRIAITPVYTISFIITTVFSQIAPIYFQGDNFQYWQPNDGGWELHVISTTFEWALGFLVTAYMITYYKEFHNSHVFAPTIKLGPGLVDSKNSDANLANGYRTMVNDDANEMASRSTLKA